MKKSIILIPILSLITVALLFKTYYITKEIIEVRFSSIDNGIEYQVYYSSGNEDFNEKNSVKLQSQKSNELTEKTILIESAKKIDNLRFDIGSNPSEFKIKNLMFIGNKTIAPTFEDFNNKKNDQISNLTNSNGIINFKTIGNDPFFVFNNIDLKEKEVTGFKFEIFIMLIISTLIFYTIFYKILK
ncbi:hypothetical protein HQN89_33580 [Paenibacillus frigoriresistens]|uniref:hypothetical protein n=1 Tax=Paenibacillus alginolyticus TaxID=59839 RepID=UPI001564F721|nr:hypothetical protein [Paenibacillus frigoriresistens]NRF95760.1 hypothetical protein [Paenibacillus frigoriresistens]